MKNLLRHRAAGLLGLAAATLLSSCYYDPYFYGEAGQVGNYSSGYGYGYGYGGSNFSTSFFVSTGDPGWAYDPYCRAYYSYSRRCYYDPYLNGYYPVGYRPPVIVGCPHPYGYRSGYCPPPRGVRNVTVVNYSDRLGGYRRSNYDWARQVRQQPIVNRVEDRRPSNGYQGPSSRHDSRLNSAPSRGSSGRSPEFRSGSPSRQATPSRSGSRYNQPVNVDTRTPSRTTFREIQQSPSRPKYSGHGLAEPRANQNNRSDQNFRQERSGGNPNSGRSESRKEESRREESRSVRGLGQSR